MFSHFATLTPLIEASRLNELLLFEVDKESEAYMLHHNSQQQGQLPGLPQRGFLLNQFNDLAEYRVSLSI